MITINSPPAGVTVTTAPLTKELAQRSSNTLTKRKSLDGRRIISIINDFPFQANDALSILADKFPSGLDPTLDASQSSGTSTNSEPVFP